MPFQEFVEAEGHLIDSHVVENAFDKVVEFHGRFEVDQFRIGRTNSEPSYLRMMVETPDAESLDRLLAALLEMGCSPVATSDAVLREVERDRLSFAFMANGISSERQVETAVRQTATLVRQTLDQHFKVVAVAGPVVVHTGGVAGLASLIRNGCIQAVLSGNALGVHDVESALFGTSLGVRLSDGRQEEHGHRNHMRAINAIYRAGSVREAVECGRLRSGVLYECVKAGVPFVLAGSLRDDGPLPETITDMNAAQDAYAVQLKGAGLVLCLGSMLHSIATGNMLPSWVKIVCVDINPAVATKVSDRGTGQAVGVVADVGLFLDLLAKALA
jgi:lysine-ketoglutarate reductase/saccharopine dehydrogenase-like protein (TIGR00300 family)